MGEATYYFKALFKTKKEAKVGYEKIKEYLTQSDLAYHEWQDIRGRSRKPGLERFKKLKEKYPLVFSQIPDFKVVDASMNELAGLFIDSAEGLGGDSKIFVLQGKEVRFSILTWHFDDWRHLVRYAQSLGAKAGYISDEYTTPYYWDMVSCK